MQARTLELATSLEGSDVSLVCAFFDPSLHFLRRHVLDMGGDSPNVADRVSNAGVSVTVELVCWFANRGSACFQRSFIHRVNVVDVNVELACHCLVLRGGISHHDDGISNFHFGMSHTAFRAAHEVLLFRVEGTFQELNHFRSSLDNQIWSDGMVALRHWSNLSNRLHSL